MATNIKISEKMMIIKKVRNEMTISKEFLKDQGTRKIRKLAQEEINKFLKKRKLKQFGKSHTIQFPHPRIDGMIIFLTTAKVKVENG